MREYAGLLMLLFILAVVVVSLAVGGLVGWLT
jgi:hypothetical protein